jgi:hypothetical protein
MNSQPTRVFISYSHDSDEQMDRVLQFSEQLRTDGVDSHIDRYEQSPPEGWPRWCFRQVQESEFILVVCTNTYMRRFDGKEVQGEGKGVAFEGNIVIQTIYDDQSRNVKFIPITFSAKELEFIPLILRGSSFYNVSRVREYEDLYRRLTHQPPLTMKPIGKIKRLPAISGPSAVSPSPLGLVRSFAALGHPQTPLDLAIPLRLASSTQRERQSAPSKSQKTPTIYATFEFSDGKPVVKGKSYKIWVAVKNVPGGTQKVNYEILDDTFPDPKFSVTWGKKDFTDWITSYGDIFLTARGKGENGPWRTQTTLSEALKTGYGPNLKTIIRKAIADIENN